MHLTCKFLLILFFLPLAGFSQQADTLVKNLDSVMIREDGWKIQSKGIHPAINNNADIGFKTYFSLLADNFKRQVTSPFNTSKKSWLKVGGFALLTAAVSLANEPVHRFAVRLHNEKKVVADISRHVTNFGGVYEVYTLAAFYAYGLIFKTQKEKTTTVLATQAYLTAGVLSTAGKYLSGVQRPYYTDLLSNKKGPIFRGPFYPFKKQLDQSDFSSFPSGHTTVAFAAATVYALEYRDKPLIPIISYGAATLIGLSRITENKHWPTDVLVGAILGYLSGRQVVNNFHRYSNVMHGKTRQPPLSFNFNYNNKQFLSGLIYNF